MSRTRVTHYQHRGSGVLSILPPVGTIDPPVILVLFFPRDQHSHQHFKRPAPIHDPRRHGRGCPMRRVRADEVVDEVVQGDSVLVVAPLLAEPFVRRVNRRQTMRVVRFAFSAFAGLIGLLGLCWFRCALLDYPVGKLIRISRTATPSVGLLLRFFLLVGHGGIVQRLIMVLKAKNWVDRACPP